MKAKVLMIAAAFAAVGGMVSAQDWGGGYVGLSANSGDGNLDLLGSPFAYKIDGGTELGIYAGYNHVLASNLVVGGELSYSSAEGNSMPVTPWGYDGMLQARARVGYAMDNIMPYVALGMAKTDFNVASTIFSDETGITFAVGMDYMMNDKMSLRFEYNEARFNSVGEPTIFPPDVADLKVKTLTIGAAFHF